MKVIGLTGSIGMGKTVAAGMLRAMGLAVFDSDAVVHGLTAPRGPALPAIEAAFPGTVVDGRLDRQALGSLVFNDPTALKRLEAILHPLVRRRRAGFLAAARRSGRRRVVLDVPLLYETRGERECDAVLVMTAPAFLQRRRVLARPGMTEAKFRDILSRQMPDREKRRRADWVIHSGLGKAVTWRQLKRALNRI